MGHQKDENAVHLRGRATKDAESKFTSTGKMVTKFCLATSFGKDKSEFHNIEAWSSEEAASVKKGQVVELWGYLKTNSWDDKSGGGKKYMTVVVANKFVDAPLTPQRPISDEITDADIPF